MFDKSANDYYSENLKEDYEMNSCPVQEKQTDNFIIDYFN